MTRNPREPSLQTHNTDTYALKLLGMSPNSSHLTPIPHPAYTSGMHLEPGHKKHEENMHFHIEKKIPKQTDTFSLFLDEFL